MHIKWLTRAVFSIFSKANSDHFTFLRFLFCGVRDDDAAAHLFALINSFHDHTVVQWLDFGCHDFLQSPSLGLLPGVSSVRQEIGPPLLICANERSIVAN